ncbi:hypothetical protein MP228_011777 [Amoeboaphelidium protococcarum]|nr:hypothetical protein MP228_011777 [Amoeboaphelidium protococcarum]
MTCDVSDQQLKEAYEEIRSGGDSTWLIAGYKDTKDVISLYCKGASSFDDLKNEVVSREEVLFIYVKIDSKYALLTFIGEKVVGVKRARALVHGRVVANTLKEHNTFWTVTSNAEFTEKNLRRQLNLLQSVENLSSSKASSINNLNMTQSAISPASKSSSPLSQSAVEQSPQIARSPLSDAQSVTSSNSGRESARADPLKKDIQPPTRKDSAVGASTSGSKVNSRDDFNHARTGQSASSSPNSQFSPSAEYAQDDKKPAKVDDKASRKADTDNFGQKVSQTSPVRSVESSGRDSKVKELPGVKSLGHEIHDAAVPVKGFVFQQDALSCWKRRFYGVSGRDLVLMSDLNASQIVKKIDISKLKTVTPIEEEIMIKFSVQLVSQDKAISNFYCSSDDEFKLFMKLVLEGMMNQS